MTIKQKFERIDQSKLEQKQVDALNIVLKFTEDFKTTDKEKIKITNDKLDNIIAKLQEKNPDAIKPIASDKKASSTKAPRRNVFSVAKQIQKSGESFDDAKKRASQQMKDEKAATNKVVANEMKSLLEYIKKHKELDGIHGTDLKRDSTRVAKVGGRRISKNGKIYYENRENRKDRLAPNYPKDAPLLANGAYLTDPTFGNFQTQVFKKGGLLTAKERYFLEIKGQTGLRIDAIEKYTEDNNLSDNDVLNIVVGLGRKQLKGADVSTAIVGKKDNSESKKLIAFVKDNKAMKLELGGTMVADLAGHTGGGTGGLNNGMPLSGFTGTHYTGLVGETGTMSSGEMFAKGGSIPNNYEGKSADEVWKDWNYDQKYHFLSDHREKIGFEEDLYNELKRTTKPKKSSKGTDIGFMYIDVDKIINTKYTELPRYVKFTLLDHVRTGQYAIGGSVPAGLHGAVHSYSNAYANEGATAGMSYSDGGKITRSREEYLENLGDLEAEVWDKIGANSGSEIRADKTLLKKYAQGVEKIMETNGIGHGSFDQDDYDYFTDQNFHLFNEFLVWNNYYEPEMTKVEKAWRRKDFKTKSNYISDPEVITLNQTKRSNSGGFKVGDVVAHKTNKTIGIVRDLFEDYKGDLRTSADGVVSIDELEIYDPKKHKDYHIAPSLKKELGMTTSKKYVPHYEIASVTVKKDGKEVTYKGSDVLNGANELKKGGDISKLGTYIAKRDVVSVTLKNGDKIKPANGYWVKKDSKSKFDEGGEVEEATINKDGIKVKSVAMPKKSLSEAEWLAKHNESNEARAYKKGGSLDDYSQFIQDEFPKAKREANKFSKKYKEPYIVYVEDKNDDKIGLTLARIFYNYPKSYQDAHVVMYLTPVSYSYGGKVTFDEKSHAIAERLEFTKVAPKYQKEYGKTYSEEEAEKAGDRIAGSMIKKEKMSKGAVVKKGAGSPNMKVAVAYAKSTRKAGESWTSALKRGWDSLK
jgi:hypothetical protein